jgi:hypothetical protein
LKSDSADRSSKKDSRNDLHDFVNNSNAWCRIGRAVGGSIRIQAFPS